MNKNEFLNHDVRLTSCPKSCKEFLIDFPNLFIEKVLLLRWGWTGYYNSTRANLRLISAIWTSIVSITLIYIVWLKLSENNIIPSNIALTQKQNLQISNRENTREPNSDEFNNVKNHCSNNDNSKNALSLIAAFISMVGILFWYERRGLYEKWIYLAGLYNDYAIEDDQCKREIMRISLALDLIETKMWNHKSFNTLFKLSLGKAILFSKNNFPNDNIEIKFDNVKGIQLPVEQAARLLSNYQHSLSLIKNNDMLSDSEINKISEVLCFKK